MNIIISIITSIIASSVIALSTWLYAKRYKKHITILFGKFSGSEVEYVYKNDDDAKVDMVKYTKRSDVVKILSMRAFRMLYDNAALSFLLRENNSIKEVRVLLADPTSLSVSKRANEFINIDPSYTSERYKEDIQWSVNQVGLNLNSSKLKLRLHKEPAFVRLLITDDYLFLSFFLKDTHGDNSCVFRVNRFSPLYESYCRYHDWIWENNSLEFSKTPSETTSNTGNI